MLPILFRIPSNYVLTGFVVVEILLGGVFLVVSIMQKRVSWTPLFMAAIVEVIRRFVVAPSLGPDVPVYSYGVMLVAGFFACLQLAKFLARRSGIDPEVFVNAGLIALVTGVLGSRLSHVLENLHDYTQSREVVAQYHVPTAGGATTAMPAPVEVTAKVAGTYNLLDASGRVLETVDVREGDKIGFEPAFSPPSTAAGGPNVDAYAGGQHFKRPDAASWERPVSVKENLANAVNIRSGGLTFYGGLILGTVCTIAYGWYKRVPIRTGMDIVAPCVMIGLAFGRIGCLLNGCCYGAECDKATVPWAIHYPYGSNAYVEEYQLYRLKPPPALIATASDGRSVLVPADRAKADPALAPLAEEQHSLWLHPAQIYSTITAFMIAALLVAYYTLPHAPGRGFALMLLIESPARFLLEMLRAEPAVIGKASLPPHLTFLPPMSFSMVMSVILFALGVVLWFWFGRGWKRPERADQAAVGTGPAAA